MWQAACDAGAGERIRPRRERVVDRAAAPGSSEKGEAGRTVAWRDRQRSCFPSRRDSAIAAQGGAKASLARLGVALGREALPTDSAAPEVRVPTGRRSSRACWLRPIPPAPQSAATLWLALIGPVYPGRRGRSLRSRPLALGSDRTVALRLVWAIRWVAHAKFAHTPPTGNHDRLSRPRHMRRAGSFTPRPIPSKLR